MAIPDLFDDDAYVLNTTYNLSPPRHVSNKKPLDPGKYEPVVIYPDESRTVLIAHWFDKTNILVQYDPAELQPAE